MHQIAIIGTGYVGLVSGTCFAEVGNRVLCCDIDEGKIRSLQQGDIPIHEPGLQEMVQRNASAGRLSFTTDIAAAIQASDIIYIAVGTPMSTKGEADLSYVQTVAQAIGENLNTYKIIVNKSTVPVGTGRKVQQIIRAFQQDTSIEFDVVSNPEFLREGSAVMDCMNMERAVIGATNERASQAIADLHKPFGTQIMVTDMESAEMIKYASNGFLATKISYINAIANLCEYLGGDVMEVARGMGMDSRIGSKFLQAGLGYGGSCFPKDTHAMVHMAESVGYNFELMRSVISTNDKQKVFIVEKIVHILGELEDRNLAVLGLAYKPNTNDMRDAPSLQIIPALLEKGAVLNCYDPVALPEARKYFGDQVNYVDNLAECLVSADAAIILTEWDQIQNLDLNSLKELMRSPVIVDGRNCFTPEQMRRAGIIYHSVGRKPVMQDEGVYV